MDDTIIIFASLADRIINLVVNMPKDKNNKSSTCYVSLFFFIFPASNNVFNVSFFFFTNIEV